MVEGLGSGEIESLELHQCTLQWLNRENMHIPVLPHNNS